jgi:hypothetical protein
MSDLHPAYCQSCKRISDHCICLSKPRWVRVELPDGTIIGERAGDMEELMLMVRRAVVFGKKNAEITIKVTDA